MRVREAGPRSLGQITPSELTAAMRAIVDEIGWEDAEAVLVAIAGRYGGEHVGTTARERLRAVLLQTMPLISVAPPPWAEEHIADHRPPRPSASAPDPMPRERWHALMRDTAATSRHSCTFSLYACHVSAPRDHLRELVEQLPDEQVAAAISDLESRLAVVGRERPWPPAWFAVAEGSALDVSERV